MRNVDNLLMLSVIEQKISWMFRMQLRVLPIILIGWKEVYSHYPSAFIQRAAISASPAPGQYNNALFPSLATMMRFYLSYLCVPSCILLLQPPTNMLMGRRLTVEGCWLTLKEDAPSKDGILGDWVVDWVALEEVELM